jgi:hypothetical protein
MRITKDTLKGILEETEFCRVFTEYAEYALGEARLFPKMSKPRLVEAFGAWKNDLTRVGSHEPRLDEGLDHLKQAGHLAFWLRRMSPIIEAYDLNDNLADSPGYDLTDTQVEFRKLLLGYCNEYLAFDFGFNFCKFYEIGKDGGSRRASDLVLSQDYYMATCHFLKFKNVSPHAMHLIYKSLFFE